MDNVVNICLETVFKTVRYFTIDLSKKQNKCACFLWNEFAAMAIWDKFVILKEMVVSVLVF